MKPIAWDDYRVRRALFLSVFIGFVFVVPPFIHLATVIAKSVWGGDDTLLPFAAVSLIYFCLALIVGRRFAAFPCPRCDSPFFSYKWTSVPWANECQHCRWQKWREFDAEVDPPPTPAEERVECLECGAIMPAGEKDTCNECGWCYRER